MTAKPTFKRVMEASSSGKVLEPLLMNALYEPTYKAFKIPVRGGRGNTRKPDGWFHPSTHPLWPERQLYYYLLGSDDLIAEPLEPTGTLATTAGTFWHEFIGHVALDAGILVAIEVPVEDSEVRSRGSMDGITKDGEGWELKTSNGMKLAKLEKGRPDEIGVIESFRAIWPTYYAQAQEYLRMSGLECMRVTMIEPSYPFKMREIAIPYNRSEAMRVRDKYATVVQAVADQCPPRPCCGPGSPESKACFARAVCPIGSLAQ